jgi:hypothetical protein
VAARTGWRRFLPLVSVGLILVVVIFSVIRLVTVDAGDRGVYVFLLVAGLLVLALRGIAALLIKRAKRIAAAENSFPSADTDPT